MPKKILLVDDNKDILFSIAESLKAQGCKYEYLKSESAKKALLILKKEKPDLILLDLMMPEMDGWELASIIKKDTELHTVPIIIVSAKNEISDKLMGKFVSEYYIQKPFEPKDLKEKIESIIGK